MLITSTISADLMAPGFPPLVYAVQGEQYSRQITMHLYDGGLPWTVPGGVYIAMRYSKPDGTKGYYDTLPDGSRAWSASGNQVNIFVAPQMLAVPGFVTAQLEIIQNQSILASFSLRLKVEPNPAAALQQSEDYVNWLKWMEDQLKQALKDAAASGEFTGPAPTLEINSTQYQAGTSPQTPPTGKWLDNVPSVPQGQYLWTKHTSKWNNSSPVTEYSVAYQGQDGTDAQLEIDTVDYQIGTSGDTPPSGQWSSTIPAPQPGKYFWTRRTKKWNTGTARVDYSVAYAGTNGTPATVQTQKLEYQVGADGKTPPSGAWSPEIPTVPQGQYLWMRYTLKFNTGSPQVIQMPTYQGINGTGSVSSVAGVSPDPQGNVPLTAEDVSALPTTGGGMTGPIKMQGQPISGLNDPEDETDAARKGYVDRVIKKAAPINLLDNSDFTNPVNQRGIANTTAKLSYPLDRWLYDFDGVPGGTGYDPENKYLYLINKSGSEKWDALYQAVPAEKLGVGKYTITLHEKIIAPVLLYAIVDDSTIVLPTAEHTPTENGIVVATFEIKQAPKNKMLVAVYVRNKQTVAFDWAALYPGEYTADTIPEYHPKGYTTELLVCQRYYVRLQYQQYNTIGVGYEGSNYAFTQIALAVPMRISNPSLTVSAPIQMGSVPRTPTLASIKGSNMIMELQYATITSNIGAMYCYCPTEAGVVIDLSADL